MIDRRRALMGGTKGRWPSEYQKVEWIRSFGDQYIDTNLRISSNAVVELSFYGLCTGTLGLDAYPNALQILGSHSTSNRGDKRFAMYLSYNITYLYFGSYSPQGYLNVRINFSQNINTIRYDRNGIYHNGQLVKATIDPNEQFVCDRTFLISATNGSTRGKGCGKFVNVKIEDGTTKRDFIPCYRKSDGVIGMYDLCGSICPLTNTPFYINAGTGEFTKGADVE